MNGASDENISGAMQTTKRRVDPCAVSCDLPFLTLNERQEIHVGTMTMADEENILVKQFTRGRT